MFNFASSFCNRAIFQKFERSFFDKVEVKSVFIFEKRPLSAELKSSVTEWAIDYFSFATRGCFSKVNTLLASMVTWTKEVFIFFLKDAWL